MWTHGEEATSVISMIMLFHHNHGLPWSCVLMQNSQAGLCLYLEAKGHHAISTIHHGLAGPRVAQGKHHTKMFWERCPKVYLLRMSMEENVPRLMLLSTAPLSSLVISLFTPKPYKAIIFWETQEFYFILDKSNTLTKHNIITKHFYFVFLYPLKIYSVE